MGKAPPPEPPEAAAAAAKCGAASGGPAGAAFADAAAASGPSSAQRSASTVSAMAADEAVTAEAAAEEGVSTAADAAAQDAAARKIQAAWRGLVHERVCDKWRTLLDDLRDATLDAADDAEEEAEAQAAAAVTPEAPSDAAADADGLPDAHAPVRQTSRLARISQRLSARIPPLALERTVSVIKALAGVPLPAPALPARRRRTRTPQVVAPDREGDYIHPKDLVKTVLRGPRGERRAYPGVVRSWADARTRARAAGDAAAPRLRPLGARGRAAPYPLLTTRIAAGAVGELGEGIGLYFRWLTWLARLFFLCGLLATPGCIFHVMAQRRFRVFSDRQDVFAQVTLGTQQVSNAMDVTAGSPALLTGSTVTYFGYTKERLLLACSLLDVAYVALFLLVVLYMRISQQRVAKTARNEALTIGRFSVLLPYLPVQAPASAGYAGSIRKHFEQAYGAGSVAEVALATACSATLRLFRTRGAALTARRRAAALVNATRGTREADAAAAEAAARVRAADAAIALAFERGAGASEAVAAFVTFETAGARDRCLAEHNSLRGRLFPPRRLRYQGGAPLAVAPAPEPSNVLWTHLEYGPIARFLRSSLTNCLTVALMVATFGIIVAAETVSERLPPNVSQRDTAAAGTLDCAALWPMDAADATVAAAARAAVRALAAHASTDKCAPFVASGVFLGYGVGGGDAPPYSPLLPGVALAGNTTAAGTAYACGAQLCYHFHCNAAGVAAWAQDAGGERAFCTKHWTDEFTTTALLVASSGVVVVVNFLFRALIKALTSFEKHHTVSSAEAAIAFKFFCSTVVNTSLIFLIVYGAVQGFPHGLLSIKWLFGGKYYSFTRDWYAEVGASFIRTMALNAVASCAVTWLAVAVVRRVRVARRKAAVTQAELNATYDGFGFELAQRYGEQTAYVFLALLFSAGMPILVWFCCAYFTLWFWSDKALLLRYARTPPAYDGALAASALRLLPLAAAAHFAFGVWMFSDAGADSAAAALHARVGSAGVLGLTVDDGLRQNTDLSTQFAFRTRILKVAALPQFIGLLIMALVTLLVVVARVARRVFGVTAAACAACCNCAVRSDTQAVKLPTLSDARFEAADAAAAGAAFTAGGRASMRARGQWHGPPSFAMSHDPRYAALFADPLTGAAVAAAKQAKARPGKMGQRAQAALARAAIEGFVVFDAAAAVHQLAPAGAA